MQQKNFRIDDLRFALWEGEMGLESVGLIMY